MGIADTGRRSLADVLQWLRSAPPSTMLTASDVLQALDAVNQGCESSRPEIVSPDAVQLPWSALLWLVPDQTRIGVRELCEATGRPKSWVYRHTSNRGDCPRLPFYRCDGVLTFRVGEIRRWLENHEVISA